MKSGATLAGEMKGDWVVRAGPSNDIISELQSQRSEVLAFIVPDQRDLDVHAKFEVLKQVAGLIHGSFQNRTSQKWDELVQALTPDVQLSSNRIAEAEMMSAAKTAVLRSGDFAPSAAVGEAAGYSSANPSSQPNRWKRSGHIFAITHKGNDYYPLYALDPLNSYRPYPALRNALRILARKDGWGLAFWFASVNGYLKNRCPKDMLASDPALVVRAAETEAAGLLHG